MTPPHDAPLKIIRKASAGTIAPPPAQLLTYQGKVRDIVFLADLSNAATPNCAHRRRSYTSRYGSSQVERKDLTLTPYPIGIGACRRRIAGYSARIHSGGMVRMNASRHAGRNLTGNPGTTYRLIVDTLNNDGL